MLSNKTNGNRVQLIYIVAFFGLFSSTVGGGCRKLVESPPPSNLVAETNVFSIDATAIAVLNGMYISMTGGVAHPLQGTKGISLLLGLASDELSLLSGVGSPYLRYYQNSLTHISYSETDLWAPFYNYIFKCNAAIEVLRPSFTLNTTVKQYLLGEALFLRAYFYFYLANIFGDIPLVLSTDPAVNVSLYRESKLKVFEQIIIDLNEAKGLLPEKYVSGNLLTETSERTRPNKWAATAMLARVYLFVGDYEKAEIESSLVIDNSSLYGLLPNLNSVFIKNSKEAIWQIQPTDQSFNTYEARTFVIPPTGPNPTSNFVFLSKDWLNNFELGDQRKVLGNWVDSTIYNKSLSPLVRDTVYYCYKYKKNEQDLSIVSTTSTPGYTFMSEYFMILRLAEQYLIRAEARARLGKVGGAQTDLNTIRIRAGLSQIFPADETSLLAAILDERRHELFCEWGHRWFDLKRTGKIDQVMDAITPLKSNGVVQWQPYQALHPIPLKDLQSAPNLTQNSGY